MNVPVKRQKAQREDKEIFNDAVIKNAVIFGIDHYAELIAKGNKSGSSRINSSIKSTDANAVSLEVIKEINKKASELEELTAKFIVNTKKFGILLRLVIAMLYSLYKYNGNKDFYVDLTNRYGLNRNSVETWLADGRLLQDYAMHLCSVSGHGAKILDQLCEIHPYTINTLRRLWIKKIAMELLGKPEIKTLNKRQLLNLIGAVNKGKIEMEDIDDEIQNIQNNVNPRQISYSDDNNTCFKQALSNIVVISDVSEDDIPSLEMASCWWQTIQLMNYFLENPDNAITVYLLKHQPELEEVMKK